MLENAIIKDYKLTLEVDFECPNMCEKCEEFITIQL